MIFMRQCTAIAEIVSTSFYVQEYPKKYPIIISCIPTKEIVEDAISSNELPPAVQTLEQKPSTIQNKSENTKNVEPGIKLKWNGASDTLYDMFRQIKNHHLPGGSALIEDSYDKIALFIQQSFIGFDEVATSTIRGN